MRVYACVCVCVRTMRELQKTREREKQHDYTSAGKQDNLNILKNFRPQVLEGIGVHEYVSRLVIG